jgi:hypothetical protein
MSAENDKRDGDEEGRRPRQHNQGRPGGAGRPRGDRQGGARDSSGSPNREGGRRDGPRGRNGKKQSGGFSKPRDESGKPRDESGRPRARRPRTFRSGETEGSFRDRPRQRGGASHGKPSEGFRPRRRDETSYGKSDDARPSNQGGNNSEGSRDRRTGGSYGKRDDARRTGPAGRRGNSSGSSRERRDGGSYGRRDQTGRPGPAGRGGSDRPRRRDDGGARNGEGGERRTAPRNGSPRRDDTRTDRSEGRRFAARQGRRPADRRPFDSTGRAEEETRPRRETDPPVPADVTGDELDRAAKSDLKTLPKDLANDVARHLVMAGRLVDEDPALAYKHALVARRKAARVGVVREACGLAAYHAGLWSVALSELRAARRLTGQEAYLAVMADAERGLGRPERALDLARSEEAKRLPPAEAIEMRIVESGARRDLGQFGAAVLALQVPELKDERLRPWSARLFYAYADALVAADREEEASDWFARAAAADRDGETDAAERYAEIEGLDIIDDDEDES